VTPKDAAKQLCNEFEAREGPGVWTFLHRTAVAQQMQDRIDEPNLVNQGGVGLCGPAAFLRDLIIEDPVLYAIIGRDLFERGSAHLVRGHGNNGGLFLEPDKDLRTYNIPIDVASKTKDLVIPEADWMVLASIRQSCRHWFWQHHFYEAKRSEGGTTADQIVDLFKDMGYSKVVDATGSKNEHSWYTAYTAGLYAAAGYHVMMIIDDNLLVPLTQPTLSEIPYHWVSLESPLTGPANAITFKIWTWAIKQLVSVPVAGSSNFPVSGTDAAGNLSATSFLKFFYGFVAAKF
jgi:hypothetical protein